MPLGFHSKPTGLPGEWFYCIKHQKVEEGPECPAKDRLGPYASKEEAGHALELAAERNREWRDDPRWRDGPPGGDTPGGDTPGGDTPGGDAPEAEK